VDILGQVVALERFLATIRQTGCCVVVTDLDEMLTAFSVAISNPARSKCSRTIL
jgi:hypothetical protein